MRASAWAKEKRERLPRRQHPDANAQVQDRCPGAAQQRAPPAIAPGQQHQGNQQEEKGFDWWGGHQLLDEIWRDACLGECGGGKPQRGLSTKR